MINDVTRATSTDAGSAQATVQERSQMGKEEFLRLLVTQLSHQDPLNPMDGQEFAAQLAQFSSVEQLLNIQQTLVDNGELNGMLAQGINSGVASGLIGRDIDASTPVLYWDGGGASSASVDLNGAAASVKVVLRDTGGNIVRTLDLGALGEGRHEIDWNGRDQNGAAVPKGTYHMEVIAEDAAGDSVNASTTVSGRVDRVTFGQDGIKLWIGELSLAMSHVTSVKEAGDN